MKGTTGVALGATALVFLVAGILFPELAGGLLRLFVATLALVLAGVWTVRAVLALRFAQDFYSPFEDETVARASVTAPRLLRRLRMELDGVDDARIAERKAIPVSARDLVAAEAGRRLAERHGLVLADPAHHEQIRLRLSEPAWLLIRPFPATGSAAGGAPAAAVPLGRLEEILEEVERL